MSTRRKRCNTTRCAAGLTAVMLALTVQSIALAADSVGTTSSSGKALLDPQGWPCWQGPFGSGYRDFGYPLVKDRRKVKQLWISEERNIAENWIGPEGTRSYGISGGYGGPMAYRDRIYHAWYWPSNDVADEPQAKVSKDMRLEKWKVTADDIIVCMDPETGTNIWKTAFEGRGWPSQLSMHHALMMLVAWDGKIYLNGSGGWLYCVDAATGEKLWESRLGAFTDAVDKYKAAGITHFGSKVKDNASKAKGLPFIRRAPLLSVAAVAPTTGSGQAGGVVVVNDERNFGKSDDDSTQGLTAFDALTGAKLWSTECDCVGGISSPIVTVWRDRVIFVSSCYERAVGLDPKTGTVLWRIEVADRKDKYVAAGATTPCAADGYVILQGQDYEETETSGGGGAKKVKKSVYPSCWKVDGEKPELVWVMERPGRSPGSGRGGNPIIYQGRAYVPWNDTLYCLDLKTNKELSALKNFSGIMSGTVSDGIYLKQSAMARVDGESMTAMDQKGGVHIQGGGFDHSCIYKGRLYAKGKLTEGTSRREANKGLAASITDPKCAIFCYDLGAGTASEDAKNETKGGEQLRTESRRNTQRSRTMKRIKGWMVMLSALMLTGSVWASTDFGVGTVVSMNKEGRTFVVRHAFYNGKPAGIWTEDRHDFDFAGGWGQRCYFLDGKPVATAEEALGVGRAISLVDDGMAYFVSSKSDFFFLGQHGTLEDGLCRITLENAACLRYAEIDSGKPELTRDWRHPVELLVDMSAEGMSGVLVVPPMQKGFTDHVLDCSTFKREGNTLSGSISFSARPTEIVLDGAEKIELKHDFEVTFGEKGAVSGTWTGVLNGKAGTGAVSGVTLARRPVTPDNIRIWLQVMVYTGIDKGWMPNYVVMTMKDGKILPGGHVCMNKGAVVGEVSEADLKLTATNLAGTIRYTFGSAVRERRVDCRILGGNWIDGTMIDKDKKAEPCRGGFSAMDSVPIRKCTMDEYAAIRAMQPEGSNGRILTYPPVLKHLEELKKAGRTLPEAPKMKPVTLPGRRQKQPVKKAQE